jgi:serine phosphatase RsbU (regulator of sigma subunit)
VLKQKGTSGEQKDGMDMTLVAINKENLELQFAGANNPLYLIRNGELTEIKGDKMPIAIHLRMDPFKNNNLQLEKGDSLYLFTDGFADQFGGPKNRKFMYKQFKEILLQNCHKPMSEQKEIIENAFLNWKGNGEQIDDVTVVGIRI